jgi:AcrR family transcriptional regulator
MDSPLNKKYNQLIDHGRSLFTKYGFKRVTVTEICSAANVSKMTFYKYFKNKTELLKMILNSIAENQMNSYEEIMRQDIAYSAKVEQIIRMKQNHARMVGQELFNDLYTHAPEEISQLLHEIGARHFIRLRDDFIKAQQEGLIRKDIRPDFIIYFLNHLIDMVSEETLTAMYDSTESLISELTRFFFYGIMTGKR